MKKVLLPLLGILLLAGCEKESTAPAGSEADQTLDLRSGKVTVCHLTGSETNAYEILEIADQAWIKSHMEHGDFLLPTWYADADGDGFGDPATSTTDCVRPEGYVADNTDCDDTDPAVNPGAEENCDDNIDNDCDGLVNEDCLAPVEVTINNGSETYTLYIHPLDQRLGFPSNGGVPWGSPEITTGAIDNWDGPGNTQKIVEALEEGDYAAKVCADLNGAAGLGYNDWYLPSQEELLVIFREVYLGAGNDSFKAESYWSSTEHATNPQRAYYLAFPENAAAFINKDNDAVSCRCVRR